MVIDCDTHVIPKDAFDYMGEGWSHLRPALRFDDRGLYTHCDFAGKPATVSGTTPLPSFADSRGGSGSDILGMCDFEARVKDMDLLGTDRQVLLPQFSPWAWSTLLEPRLAAAIARSYNGSILKVMEEYPGKFIGVALAPIRDVETAVREVEWSKSNGFKAVVCDYTYCSSDHPYGETLGERRELWPFFQKIEEAGLVLYLHAVQHGHRAFNFQRFQKIGLDIFAPHDGHMTLVSLITSGLLDEFPGLQVVYTEGGTGWIAPLARRLDERFRRSTPDYSRDAGTSLGSGSARPSG
ncbi:MAG TPA: amidohydrolase family protein, partial [Vicinamibacteria bacterium]